LRLSYISFSVHVLFDTPLTFSGEDPNVWSFPESNGIKTFKSDTLQRVEENLLKVRILIRSGTSSHQKTAIPLPKNTYTAAVSKPDSQLS